MRIQNFIETINGQELVLIGLTLGCFICNTHTSNTPHLHFKQRLYLLIRENLMTSTAKCGITNYI